MTDSGYAVERAVEMMWHWVQGVPGGDDEASRRMYGVLEKVTVARGGRADEAMMVAIAGLTSVAGELLMALGQATGQAPETILQGLARIARPQDQG